jgi:Arginine kinase
MKNWITTSNIDDKDLVISSRIRLARNLTKIPFPHKLNEEQSREIIKRVEDAFYSCDVNKEEFTTNYMWQKSELEREIFLERHIISKNLIENSSKSAFILDKNETLSVMINEEDHVRIQCITAGLNLEEVYKQSDKVDDMLGKKLGLRF